MVGTHNAGFINRGSYWAPGGYCSGSAVLAGSWFALNREQLRERFPALLSESQFNNWRRQLREQKDQMNPAIRLASALQTEFPDNVSGFLPVSESEQRVWENVMAQLYFASAPVYIAVATADGKAVHALLAYKIDVDNGWIYVADPNYPDQERQIVWRSWSESFKDFSLSINRDATPMWFTEFREASFFFAKRRQTVIETINQYLADGLRARFPPARLAIRISASEVLDTDLDTTMLALQGLELRFTPGIDEGEVSWAVLSGGVLRTGIRTVRTRYDPVSIPLSTGLNTVGVVIYRATGPYLQWYDRFESVSWFDAKVLLVTQAPAGTGRIYASSGQIAFGASGPSDLWIVPPYAAGKDTLVARIKTAAGQQPVITDLARAPNGQLWAMSFDDLYRLDSATGVVTLAGGDTHREERQQHGVRRLGQYVRSRA